MFQGIYNELMAVKPKTQIRVPIDGEEWRGVKSVPRINELKELGLPVTAIAKRFGVSRFTLYRALNEALAKESESPATPKSAPGGAESQTTKRAKGRLPEAAKPSASAPNGG